MRCEEIQDRLDEYIDGELPDEPTTAIGEHLEGCVTCRRRVRSLQRLLERAAALPRRIEPRRDLWPGIESRIRRSPRQGRFSNPRRAWLPTAMAATLAAVMVTGALWLTLRSAQPGGSVEVTPPSTAIVQAGDPGARLQDGDLDLGLKVARQELRRALEARKASLAPATVEVIEKNLRLIDQAIAEIQAALAEDPGNRELQQLLRHSREREIALLRTAAFLPSQT